MFCSDITAPVFLIFSGEVPRLLYYSHIPTAIMALVVGFYVFSKKKGSDYLAADVLLFMSVSFFVWSLVDLILWTNIGSDTIMFFWSLINLVELLVTAATLYFAYVFLEKRDAPFANKLVVCSLITFFAVLVPSGLNITGFNSVSCEAEQGILTVYYYLLETFFLLWLLGYLSKKVISAKKSEMKFVATFAIGVICFSASFSGANLISSLTER